LYFRRNAPDTLRASSDKDTSEEMKDSPRFNLKEAWMIASVSVLVVYLIGQLKPDSELGLTTTINWLVGWMVLLSFPASLLAIVFFVLFFTWIDFRQAGFDMLFIWAGLFAAGYLQWYKFIPAMLSSDQMITLQLEQKDEYSVNAGRVESCPAYDLRWSVDAKGRELSRSEKQAESAGERRSSEDETNARRPF
jgi:accessory gene regulator protein AgrB